ncbi:MAG TPA: hypothetical protein VFS77_08890 [Pyrinomonadaceae bacterium]|nr:hypothetical protein [Pyrinomonadaceae bacterium]
MSSLRSIPRYFLAACALGLAICAQAGDTYKVKEVPYVVPQAPGPDETLIYVLREKSSFAAMQKFAIIGNDTVVGVLKPGTFTHFTVPSAQHEIVGYVSPSPLVHYRVMPSPGKTIYLFIKVGYTTGLFIEPIDEVPAKALIATFQKTDIAIKGKKAKMNYKDYYDKLYQ